METIEIDFDVFKALTLRRASASVTYNDVLRDLLGLGPVEATNNLALKDPGAPWVSKGVVFPHGTDFRAEYKGQTYSARVENGALLLAGKRYTSPSAAAMAISNSPVNGWTFWEARQPGHTRWTQIKSLRG